MPTSRTKAEAMEQVGVGTMKTIAKILGGATLIATLYGTFVLCVWLVESGDQPEHLDKPEIELSHLPESCAPEWLVALRSGTTLEISPGVVWVGGMQLNIQSATATIAAGAGNGTADIYLTEAGVIVVEYASTARLKIDCDNCVSIQVKTPAVPVSSRYLATVAVKDGKWEPIESIGCSDTKTGDWYDYKKTAPDKYEWVKRPPGHSRPCGISNRGTVVYYGINHISYVCVKGNDDKYKWWKIPGINVLDKPVHPSPIDRAGRELR